MFKGDVLIIYTYVLEIGTRVIFTRIMCKVSRCNSKKLEAIQARHHTQHATTYNSAKVEQAPVMVEKGRCAHYLHSYVDCPALCCLANLVGRMA